MMAWVLVVVAGTCSSHACRSCMTIHRPYTHATMPRPSPPARRQCHHFLPGPRAFRTGRGGGTITVGIVGATGYAGRGAGPPAAGPPQRQARRPARPQPREPAHRCITSAPEPDGPGHRPGDPEADAIFTALPHGWPRRWPRDRRARIGAARCRPELPLHDPADYPRWYKFDHPAPELLAGAVYGLRNSIETRCARRSIGRRRSSGCRAAIRRHDPDPGTAGPPGLIGDLAVDAKSGVSGAGREPKPDLLFSEVNESVKAYGVFNHRHTARWSRNPAAGERGSFGSREANPAWQPSISPASDPDDARHPDELPRAAHASGDPGGTRRPVRRGVSRRTFRPGRFGAAATKHVSAATCAGSGSAPSAQRQDPGHWRDRQPGQGRRRQAVQALNVLFGLPETTGLEQHPIAP